MTEYDEQAESEIEEQSIDAQLIEQEAINPAESEIEDEDGL